MLYKRNHELHELYIAYISTEVHIKYKQKQKWINIYTQSLSRHLILKFSSVAYYFDQSCSFHVYSLSFRKSWCSCLTLAISFTSFPWPLAPCISFSFYFHHWFSSSSPPLLEWAFLKPHSSLCSFNTHTRRAHLTLLALNITSMLMTPRFMTSSPIFNQGKIINHRLLFLSLTYWTHSVVEPTVSTTLKQKTSSAHKTESPTPLCLVMYHPSTL